MLARADTMTAHLFNLLLQSSNSRLAAVVPDQRSDSIILQLDVGRLETGALLGLRREIFARDRSLFFRDVARDLEDLHSVEERGRDRVEGVGGADKQDAGQVDRNVELHVRSERSALMHTRENHDKGKNARSGRGTAHSVPGRASRAAHSTGHRCDRDRSCRPRR